MSTTSDNIIILNPIDAHVHWRQPVNTDGSQGLLPKVIRHTARQFAGAVPMPNLTLRPGVTGKPAGIVDAEELKRYQEDVHAQIGDDLAIHWTMKLVTDYTTPEILLEGVRAGVRGFKLYPYSPTRGGTTNITSGVDLKRLKNLYPVFSAMQDEGLVLHVHGEDPDEEPLLAESAFVNHYLRDLAQDFPKLTIILEHVSCVEGVETVLSLNKFDGRVFATVTAHHLRQTHADYMGPKLRPDEYSLPPPKFGWDRDAIVEAVLTRPDVFFFGSDSAPHLHEAKYCCAGSPGVFSAPYAIPLAVDALMKRGAAQEHLQAFFSGTAQSVLRLAPKTTRTVTLERNPLTIPNEHLDTPGVTCFGHGETIGWSVTETI